MRRIRTLGLALLAIFALGALASASAFAENPEILPVPSEAEPANFGSTAGLTTLLLTEGSNIKCAKATNEGSFTSQDAGKLHIDFHECEVELKGKKSPCKTNGQGEGEILVLAEMQLVTVEPVPGTVDLGVWLKPYADSNPEEMVMLKCGVINITILGSVIGVVDNAEGKLLKSLEKFTEAKVLWIKNATTKMQEITECKLLKALCEGNKFQLEAEFGKGHELATEIADATFTFKKAIEVHF